MKYLDPVMWRDLRLDTEKPHTWAFYHFLKRRGDKVEITRQSPTSIDISVQRRVA